MSFRSTLKWWGWGGVGHDVHLYRFAGWVGVRLRKNLKQKHGMLIQVRKTSRCARVILLCTGTWDVL